MTILNLNPLNAAVPGLQKEVPMGEDSPRVSRVMVHSCHSFTSCGAVAPKISNMVYIYIGLYRYIYNTLLLSL